MPHFDKQFDNLFDARDKLMSMGKVLASGQMEKHINVLRETPMDDEDIKSFCTVHVFSDGETYHHLKKNNKLKFDNPLYEFIEGATEDDESFTLGCMIVSQEGDGHIDIVLESAVDMDDV